MLKNSSVNIIGAGLAGCEAAYFLAQNKIHVNLFEMKSIKKTPAQKLNSLAELVCSNSLKSTEPLSASGLLKYELSQLNCFLLKVAKNNKVESGMALSVDREKFSNAVTEEIKKNKYINFIEKIVDDIDWSKPTIIATGPLCDDKLFKAISLKIGIDNCYFYDAIAPIVSVDSIDMSRAFWANRYDKGGNDYLNCWLNKKEYEIFVHELVNAKCATLQQFEQLKVFESCMPIEVLAKRGERSLRFGPMKPVGLSKHVSGEKPYAIVQLRKENLQATCLNMVGFQTNLLFSEQKRVFSLIPALKNAEFLRYGTMHRNSYINAPKCLNQYSQLKKFPNVFVAGQISGVEGYVESIASGLLCAINMLLYLKGEDLISFPRTTCIGALINYIAFSDDKNFQPMNANYGIIYCDKQIVDKNIKKQYIFDNSMNEIKKIKEKLNGKLI